MNAASKIESLTAEQWQHVYEERERWRAIGTCTEPADRATAERVISGFYRRLEREPPRFVWLDGPLSCCIAAACLHYEGHLDKKLRDQLWHQLWDQLGGQLQDQLRDQLQDQLWDQLGDQLGDQLWHQLRDQLRDQLGGQLWDQLQLDAHLGQENAYWVAWMSVARDLGVVYGEEESALLDEWGQLVASTGWWWPYETICLCAERPRLVSFDERRLLHGETGPGIECRDGFCVYAWHGTRIPGEWIESPETLSAEVVFDVEDVEQRRAAAEILGWDAILQALDARVLDEHADPEIGTLYAVNLPGAPGARIMRFRCGTGRMFAQPVPEHIQTAMGAQEWIWRKEPGEYRPEVRT